MKKLKLFVLISKFSTLITDKTTIDLGLLNLEMKLYT